MSYINSLINNTGKEEGCLGVVGDLNGMYALAEIWGRYPDLLHIIGVNSLIEWTSGREFDHKELKAFQEGLAMIPEFLEKCYKEKQKQTG